MSTKITTTITEASVEDIRRIQGIGDNDGGIRGLTMAPVDWQRQRSDNFPYYHVSNSNTVLSLSCLCHVSVSF